MMGRVWPAFAMVTLVSVGCGGGGGGPGTPDAPKTSRATATFTPPAPGGGADFGAIPYPSDLFLDSTGHLKVTAFPVGVGADPTSLGLLTEGLATLDGAGVRSNVYFPVDGPVAAA